MTDTAPSPVVDRTERTAPVVLEAGPARVVVSPGRGGRIASLTIGGREVLTTDTSGPMRGGSYPMAPFAGRIRHGEFGFEGRTYRLPLNGPPHALHGYVFEGEWQGGPNGVLSIDLGPPWPFAGRVVQRFELTPDSLSQVLELHAAEPMPAWVGWHPWFRRTLGPPSEDADGLPSPPLELEFAADAMYLRDAEGIPTGELVPPPAGPWDDCFVGLRGGPALRWPGVLDLAIASSCDFWVLYDKEPDAVCVEPQTAPPDAVNGTPPLVVPGEPLVATMEWRWRLLG